MVQSGYLRTSCVEHFYISAIVANNPAIGSLDQIWIGARGINGDSRFFWADGSAFVYQNWLAGTPFCYTGRRL